MGHLRLLAEASTLLAASLDVSETLREIAHAIVPDFADWCTISLIGEDGVARRVAGVHRDPAKRQLMDEYLAGFEPTAHRNEIMLVALRDGKNLFAAQVTHEHLVATAQDDHHLAIMEGLGCTSSIVVALVARGMTVGAISMNLSDGNREFTEQDYDLARALAGRAALAIDNARRFAAERAARELAERADRAKEEFLAMLGHELRNPLAPIVTAIELMNRAGGPFEWERAVITQQTRHLSRLVDDLLDISRITGGKVELANERLELVDLVVSGIEIAGPLFKQQKHRLHVDVADGLVIDGDRTRLVQVIENLLTNAAKYTGPSGEICITGERDGDDVVLGVRDSGIGISAEMLPHVFELFVQGPQAIDRAQGGLGIGLSIAKSLVEAHGGTITAASDGQGKGSQLTVRLAAARGDPPVRTLRPTVRAHGVTARVLVVDDSRDTAQSIARALQREGCTVQLAYDGEQAIAACRAFRPTVVVLDIGLPVLDGYEVARRLRAAPELAPLTLIAVTGYGQASDKERALEAGFDHHFAKPVSIDALLSIVGAARKK
jgi:signal transduction histidine kinase/ActR/RegA family two-component response regulator